MIIWLDAQLSPALAPWIQANFGVEARALRDVGLRDSTNREIFRAAQLAGAIVMTKDSDFVKLHSQLGAPPQIIWLTCGNTSNRYLRELLKRALLNALALLEAGEHLVEISAA
jgi:predicted nuclease of predicted toxin-antitoxin system